jgi:hypothetical protein
MTRSERETFLAAESGFQITGAAFRRKLDQADIVSAAPDIRLFKFSEERPI